MLASIRMSAGSNGALENPTVETVDKLAAALQVAAADLLVVPKPDDKPPATLPKGRKKR
jgi:hypothetical protein